MVSGYPTSTSIPQVDGLSMRHPGFGASQIGIRAKVNDYLGSSVGVELGMRLPRQSWDRIITLYALCYVCLDV